ncbi:DUF3693 domain-containing protein [Piscinibacter sp.]|uniref:DUF3693 domain-containing protein n=1 Tax=Piscinibacter sp. TaxID=1903157 RepID=UPI0039E2CF03
MKAAQGISSDYRLARFLGVTDNTVANWQHGRRRPDDETAIRLAGLAGLDAGEVVAELYAERAADGPARELWQSIAKRLHTGAAAALACMFITGGPDAGAAVRTDVPSPTVDRGAPVYYVN